MIDMWGRCTNDLKEPSDKSKAMVDEVKSW